MSTLNRQRDPALRLVSLLLLLSALGSLVLSMVRISFSPVFIAELQRFPGLGTLPTACVNGGIASYSGLSLATGAAPSVNAACLTHIQDAAQASLGVQPMVLVAVLAILGAVGITLWGPRWHRLASGLLSAGAAVLLVWAGTVEAFVSQYHQPVIPYSLKIAFGLCELASLSFFLGWAGRE